MQPETRLHEVMIFGICFFNLTSCLFVRNVCSQLSRRFCAVTRSEGSAFPHSGYHCLVACRVLSHLDTNLRAEREEDVNTRSELDEAEMLVDIAVVVSAGVGHDAACYGSGYLAA